MPDKPLLSVIGITLLLAASLVIACWDMNFWPTDAEVYYMPAAKELPGLKYLSHIHHSLDTERIKWLHGKEMHVLAIALLQGLFHDTESLRPLVVLGALCIGFSAILIFAISRRLWDSRTAVWVWFFFTTCFWPYLYVLFVKHQTQGLLFFVLAVWFILLGRYWSFVLAGASMGIAVFSSTVSSLYLPFIAVACGVALKSRAERREAMPWAMTAGALFMAGCTGVLIYVNYPDIAGNLKSYWDYVGISGKFNHFYYNQKVLAQWLPDVHLSATRGGWAWIGAYFFLVMPVLFPLYIAAAGYLMRTIGWQGAACVAVSLMPVIMAEVKGVAQYGANYFPFVFGVLMVVGAAIYRLSQNPAWPSVRMALIAAAAVHAGWNAYIFCADVYPSRMATTLISRELERRDIRELYTFQSHPLRRNVLDYLNPRTLKQLSLRPIDSVIQVSQGIILLPPVSTDTIYRGSNGDYNDFDSDLVLNRIVQQGKLRDYAIASFKTLGSSLIWSQEEEIMAYRYLVRGQFTGGELSRAWLLDAERIQRDRAQLLPTADDMFLYRDHVRNIGTVSRRMMFTGHEATLTRPAALEGVALRLYKVGEPTDNLRAFVFKVNPLEPLWEPYASNFISEPVPAASLTADPAGAAVIFKFDPPLSVEPGAMSVVIYRDGKPSDQNFTRVHIHHLGRIEK